MPPGDVPEPRGFCQARRGRGCRKRQRRLPGCQARSPPPRCRPLIGWWFRLHAHWVLATTPIRLRDHAHWAVFKCHAPPRPGPAVARAPRAFGGAACDRPPSGDPPPVRLDLSTPKGPPTWNSAGRGLGKGRRPWAQVHLISPGPGELGVQCIPEFWGSLHLQVLFYYVNPCSPPAAPLWLAPGLRSPLRSSLWPPEGAFGR